MINYFKQIYRDQTTFSLQKLSSRIIIGWMIIIIISNIIISQLSTNNSSFFRFGVHDDFIILGFVIDNYYKYLLIILYCFINSIMRKISNDVLHPWLNNNIFDISYIKYKNNNKLAYEITTVAALYTWFDWFINYNILLAQVDMFITELIADVLMSNLVTKYYLSHNIHHDVTNIQINIDNNNNVNNDDIILLHDTKEFSNYSAE